MAGSISSQLSVVLLGHCDSRNFRMVLEHLRAQTVSHLMELVILAPSGEELNLAPSELEGFFSCKIVEMVGLEAAGQAKAVGVAASSAPLVAFIEDHSFPEPGWAEALIKAHGAGDFAAVGPVLLNANPHSALSLGCFLVYYSAWMTARPQKEIKHLPGNQSCYKRDLLLEYGPRLADMLQTESILHWDLLARGHNLYQEPAARVRHLNYSLLGPMLSETYLAARVFAADRARGWGLPRRVLYALGSPLLPLIRGRRILKDASRAGLEAPVVLRASGALALNLCAGAAGEMFGYAFGAGDARERLLRFDEKRHLTYTARDLEEVARLGACV